MPNDTQLGLDPLDAMGRITTYELEFFARLAVRAYKSVGGHQKEPMRFDLDRDVQIPSDGMRVASIAFQLPDPTKFVLAEDPDLELDPGAFCDPARVSVFHHTDLWTKKELRDFQDKMIEVTSSVLERMERMGKKVHFVLLNELALSFVKGGLRKRIYDAWQDLATEYEVYIVPGTSHCEKKFRGFARLFSPNPSSDAKPLRGTVYKQNTAKKVREFIKTPSIRELRFFGTQYGNVSIWICLDLYDPGLVLKLLRATFPKHDPKKDETLITEETPVVNETDQGEPIHLVLVPSLNADSDPTVIEAAARTISRCAKCAIVVCNAYPQRNNPAFWELSSKAAIAGRDIFESVSLDSLTAWPTLAPNESAVFHGQRITHDIGRHKLASIASVFHFPYELMTNNSARNFNESDVLSSLMKQIIVGDSGIITVPE